MVFILSKILWTTHHTNYFLNGIVEEGDKRKYHSDDTVSNSIYAR